MDFLKNESGITIISMIVTIIIMLILTGVTLHSIFSTNIISTVQTIASEGEISNATEIMNIACAQCKIEYLEEEKEKTTDLSQIEYFRKKLPDCMRGTFENININLEENILKISCEYDGKNYDFIYTDEDGVIAGKELLKNVKVGDYVAYPIEYDDIYANKHYTATDGWVVIDDGTAKGTSGKVKIMSRGIIGKWNWYPTFENQTPTITNPDYELTTNFKNQYVMNKNEKFLASKLLDTNMGTDISVLTLPELNFAYNQISGSKTKRALDCTDSLNLTNNIFYDTEYSYIWLATSPSNDGNSLYYIMNNKILDTSNKTMRN